MKESDDLKDIKHLVHSNAVQGEIQIGYFRFFVIFAALFMVLAISLETGLISLSEQADFFSLSTALIYNILLFWLLKRKQYYKRYLGFISSTVDIALVSTAIYLTRYGSNSSVVSIAGSSAFAVYLPVILSSLRRHDPLNSLYTGCLAGIIYFGMILIMAKEGAFGVVLRSDTGLILVHGILNECTKTAFLIVSGVLGYITSKNYDFLLYKGIRKEKENENLKFLFGRFVAPELVEKIVNKEIPLTGEKRVISVMFLDIKNFTSLSEKIEPKLLVQVLNEFFKCSEKIISKYKGFIDKFIGDAIMVEFGAPLYSENHRERAIGCAIELRNAVENISHKIKDLGVDWMVSKSELASIPVRQFWELLGRRTG